MIIQLLHLFRVLVFATASTLRILVRVKVKVRVSIRLGIYLGLLIWRFNACSALVLLASLSKLLYYNIQWRREIDNKGGLQPMDETTLTP